MYEDTSCPAPAANRLSAAFSRGVTRIWICADLLDMVHNLTYLSYDVNTYVLTIFRWSRRGGELGWPTAAYHGSTRVAIYDPAPNDDPDDLRFGVKWIAGEQHQIGRLGWFDRPELLVYPQQLRGARGDCAEGVLCR